VQEVSPLFCPSLLGDHSDAEILLRVVPDFRSPIGLYKSFKKDLFHISVFKSDASTVAAFTRMIHDLSTRISIAEATRFHRYLPELAKSGRLLRLFTQNIDCLEDKEERLRPPIYTSNITANFRSSFSSLSFF
jgi:hypothetical protein